MWKLKDTVIKLQKNLKINRPFRVVCGMIFTTVFIALVAMPITGALRSPHDARSFFSPAQTLMDFTYEIEGGASGAATFPHSFQNLAPRTAVTVYTEIEPGRYESILMKTVYTELRLYADDVLIYECGRPGSYPSWMSDPPTLLEIVPLPEGAGKLRFEYLSPSQRSDMSVPEIPAGNDGALLAWLFGRNSALLVLSFLFLVLGCAATAASLVFRHKGAAFLYLGLFAMAAGCGGLGECNATVFILPYPILLYLMSFAGMFTFTVPLLRYGCCILNPRNSFPMRIASAVTLAAAVAGFALQLAGIASFSKTMYVFHGLGLISLAVFIITAVWEYARYRNTTAKRFALPTLVFFASAVLEVVNYRLRFTNVIGLFLVGGAFVFTLMLGIVGARYTVGMLREAEKAKEAEQRLTAENAALDRVSLLKTDLMRTISHEMRTPLAVIMGFAEITAEDARKSGLDGETAANLDAIAAEAGRMADMMEEMRRLALTREYEKDRRSVDIGAVIRRIAGLYGKVLERKGTVLKLNVADGLPPVCGNAGELTQVFFNLLRNADAHTEKGVISIDAEVSDGFVKVTVRDTGTGIPPELLPHVFERGVHGANSGTGLGLAVCRDIVTAYNGEIRIDNGATGTEVIFTLPPCGEDTARTAMDRSPPP
jgi:signal transduction histidine kinase